MTKYILFVLLLSACDRAPNCWGLVGEYKLVYTRLSGNCIDIPNVGTFLPAHYFPKPYDTNCTNEWKNPNDQCIAVLKYGCDYPEDLGRWEWSIVFQYDTYAENVTGDATARWFDVQGVLKETCTYSIEGERIDDEN